MGNLAGYLLADAYASVSPALNTSSVVCMINGVQTTDCGPVALIIGMSFVFMVLSFVLLALMIVSMWKIYTKAGQPGWASIVPVYNIVVLLHIVKKPVWWILLLFIPFVNIVIFIITYHKLSESFGKDIGFTIGIILLPFVFLPILAFGKSTYMLAVSPVNQGIGVSTVPPVSGQM